jgi:ubiquitin-like protein Pup
VQRGEERHHHRHEESGQEEDSGYESDSGSDSTVSEEADDILEMIDKTLEEIENPEEWLRIYVQKGGE